MTLCIAGYQKKNCYILHKVNCYIALDINNHVHRELWRLCIAWVAALYPLTTHIAPLQPKKIWGTHIHTHICTYLGDVKCRNHHVRKAMLYHISHLSTPWSKRFASLTTTRSSLLRQAYMWKPSRAQKEGIHSPLPPINHNHFERLFSPERRPEIGYSQGGR